MAATAEKTRRAGRHCFSTADSVTFSQVQAHLQDIPGAVLLRHHKGFYFEHIMTTSVKSLPLFISFAFDTPVTKSQLVSMQGRAAAVFNAPL